MYSRLQSEVLWRSVGTRGRHQSKLSVSLHFPKCSEVWMGSSTSARGVPAVRTSFLRRVCHVNNKCTQSGDLPQAAGLWCILILLRVALYPSPSFIWIKEEEFKNSQCCTIGIQIASIYCAEWWSGCPPCPSPSRDAVQLPIKTGTRWPSTLPGLVGYGRNGLKTDRRHRFTCVCGAERHRFQKVTFLYLCC